MREFFGLPVERGEKRTSRISADNMVDASNRYTLRPLSGGFSEKESGGNEAGAGQDAYDAGFDWQMPAALLKQKTKAQPEDIRISSIEDSSMAPEFVKGEQILIDLSDRTPSPPGVFVLYDGMSHIVRSCEYVPHSVPPKIKLTAHSQKFSYVLELDKAQIIGRVIAKLQWL